VKGGTYSGRRISATCRIPRKNYTRSCCPTGDI